MVTTLRAIEITGRIRSQVRPYSRTQPPTRIATRLRDVHIRGRSEHHCFEFAIYVTDTLVLYRLVGGCLFSRCDRENCECADLSNRAAPGFKTYICRQESLLKLLPLRSNINAAAAITHTPPRQAVCEERQTRTKST